MSSHSVALDRRTLTDGGRPARAAAVWSWVPTSYFAEGLPATVVAALSALVLKQLAVPNAQIALCVAGLTLPWTLRPLWSPVLELYGTKRSFVVMTELLISVALAAMAAALGTAARAPACILLFALVALLAATHDMAVDGLYVRSLPPLMQKRYIGWLGVSFNAAKLTTQGVLVVVVGEIAPLHGAIVAWQVAFGILAMIMGALAYHHARHLPCDEPAREGPRSAADVTANTVAMVETFVRRGHMVWLLLLIALYRIAEGQLARIVPLFLLDPAGDGGLGLTTSQFGAVYGGLGGTAFVTGAVAGGWLAQRLGERRSLVLFCIAFNLPAVLYLLLASARPSLALVVAIIALEQFASGAGSVGLKLSVIAAARGPYETAHCAFAWGLTGVGATAAGVFSGALQGATGYVGFFSWVLLSAVVPILVSIVCSKRSSECAHGS